MNLDFNIVGIFFNSQRSLFSSFSKRAGKLVSFPALFFSPLSRSLQPLSGCSEGLSNCALNPCLLTSQVTHTVTSPPLFCCSQTRAPGGKIINQSAIHYTPPPNHPHCNMSAICYYSTATDTQTEISVVIQSTGKACMAVSLMLHFQSCVNEFVSWRFITGGFSGFIY